MSFPTQVGRFHLFEQVAQLGAGHLFEAEEEFAAGVTRPAYALGLRRRDHKHAVRIFNFTVQLLRRLDHPAMTRLLAVGEADEVDYLFVERCTSPTLEDCLDRPFHVSDAIRIVADIAGALAHAHKLYTVDHSRLGHLRFGPDQVHVDGNLRAKVSSVAFGPMKPKLWRQTSGDPEGNLRYVAPEQLNSRGATARSDIFALGIIFVEMLGGPIDAATAHDAPALAQLIHDRTLTLPTEIENLLTLMTVREPQRRISDASAIATELTAMTTRPRFFSPLGEAKLTMLFNEETTHHTDILAAATLDS